MGGLAADTFTNYLHPEDEHEYWRGLLAKGIVPGPVQRTLDRPHPMNDYDVRPEDIGVSLDTARQFWQQLLEV